MNAKEIEKIVATKVETIIGQFRKITPVVLKIVQETQKGFQKIDINVVSSKIGKAVQFIKNKIKDLRNSTKSSKIALKVNNEDVKKQVSQIEKEIDSLQKKISARHIKLNFTSSKLNEVKKQTTKGFMQEETSSINSGVQSIENRNLLEKEDYSSLSLQKEEFTIDMVVESEQLDIAKSKMTELREETGKNPDTQNNFSGYFNSAKEKIEKVKESFENIKKVSSKVSKAVLKITTPIKAIGSGLAKGLGYIAKHVVSLSSLQKVYSTLKDSANSWLSSQNSDAQQLSANIEYMKYAMGGVFAPVIEYVVGLVYQLMKAIQSVVYAFSGINIFAKSTASSMNNTAKSASKVNKSLGGIHGDISNVSESDSGGGSGTIAPNMDLSQMNSQMSGLASNLYDFFKPLKESWDNYGTGLIEQVKTTAGQIGGLIASVWGSFENIITNGTIYSILENILSIIGNIADAFKNAWDNNGNGDAIVQNLANAFENVLKVINNIVSSTVFQWLLNIGVGAIKIVTDAIKSLSDAALWVSEKIEEFIGFFTGENSEKLDGWAIVIGSIAAAIGLVVGAIALWNTVSTLATVATTAFGIAVNILTSPITLVILAIAALIAIIVSIIVYWDEISAALSAGWDWIKQKAEEIFTAIGEFFSNIWQRICDTITNVWNGICDFFSSIWNGIKETASSIFNGIRETISNIINGIKDTISNVLNTIKTVWNNIWNGLKTVVTNIFNGIWNTIKNIINSILSGIESFANGIVKGINRVIEALNSIKVDIPDWVPIWGGKTFGLNLKTLNEISLPRLSKGNVAYSETIAIFGEYTGASTNPEITTPQNIMRETFEDVLSNRELNSSNSANGEFKQLVIQFGSTRVALEIERLLQQARRQNGTAIITI